LQNSWSLAAHARCSPSYCSYTRYDRCQTSRKVYCTQTSAFQVYLKVHCTVIQARAGQHRNIFLASTCRQPTAPIEDAARLNMLAAIFVTHMLRLNRSGNIRQQASTTFHNQRTEVLPRRLITARRCASATRINFCDARWECEYRRTTDPKVASLLLVEPYTPFSSISAPA
jgi:hypothetical protein